MNLKDQINNYNVVSDYCFIGYSDSCKSPAWLNCDELKANGYVVINKAFEHGQRKVRFSDVGRVFLLIKVLDRNGSGAAMLETIINSIKNRHYICFTYSGITRVVQPAAVGVTSNGKTMLRCYQTQGGHVTPGHSWDFCDLSKLHQLRTTGDTFIQNPPGYKKGDKGMKKIIAEL